LDLLLVVVTPLTIITTVRVIEVLPRRKVTIYIELSVSSGTIYVGKLSFIEKTPTVLDGDWVIIHSKFGKNLMNQSSAPTTNIKREIIHKFHA